MENKIQTEQIKVIEKKTEGVNYCFVSHSSPEFLREMEDCRDSAAIFGKRALSKYKGQSIEASKLRNAIQYLEERTPETCPVTISYLHAIDPQRDIESLLEDCTRNLNGRRSFREEVNQHCENTVNILFWNLRNPVYNDKRYYPERKLEVRNLNLIKEEMVESNYRLSPDLRIFVADPLSIVDFLNENRSDRRMPDIEKFSFGFSDCYTIETFHSGYGVALFPKKIS